MRFVEMDGQSYGRFREAPLKDYAADKVRAGAWSKDEAVNKSANDIDELLPEGPATPDQVLYPVSTSPWRPRTRAQSSARTLYEKSGYQVTSVFMTRPIAAEAG